MNTDNWREETKEAARFYAYKEWRNTPAPASYGFVCGAEWIKSKLSATLKEKDAEIASLRAELEGLKEQIPGLLKEQRELCHEAYMVKPADGMDEEEAILSAPSPQIKQG